MKQENSMLKGLASVKVKENFVREKISIHLSAFEKPREQTIKSISLR